MSRPSPSPSPSPSPRQRPRRSARPDGPNSPRGLALPLVLGLLLLASVASLLVARQLWLQERLLGLQDERLRNRHLALGVLALAVQDITADALLASGQLNLRQQAGSAQQSHVFFPGTLAEHTLLQQRLGGAGCREGICVPTVSAGQVPGPNTVQDWLGRTAQAMAVRADQWPAVGAQGWYWVEVMPDRDEAQASSQAPRFHYRITALVQGLRPGGRAVWQGLWRRDVAGQPTGQWLGRRPLLP